MWVEFARAMAPRVALTADMIAAVVDLDAAPPRRVLDVGAGHGLFGIAIATRYPGAEIVARLISTVIGRPISSV